MVTSRRSRCEEDKARGSYELLLLRPGGPLPSPREELPATALRVRVKEDTSVLEVCLASGYPIGTDCGGFGKCTRCRCIPLSPDGGGASAPSRPPGWLGSPNAAEWRQLGEEELAAGWRLACQVRLKGDLAALVPLPEDMPVRKTIDTSLPVRIQPWAERVSLRVDAGPRGNGNVLLQRILTELGRPALPAPPAEEWEAIFSRLEPSLPPASGEPIPLTVTLVEGGIVDVEPGDTALHAYGAVFDIGTTNLAGYLIDLRTGALVAESHRPNGQRRWGADLMTRVQAASPADGGDDGTREALTAAVRRDVDALANDLLRPVRLRRRHLVSSVFVGNSVMHHLFLGLPVASFGAAPYEPVEDGVAAFRPAEKGLRFAEFARARFLPLLAGFVGADAVGVALALGLDNARRDKPALALDLGTNVELLLAMPDGSLWCASTPAGPAFEGGEIRCGASSVPGAICEVDLTDRGLDVRTIQGLPPTGICGTGLIETAAALLDADVLEPSGRLRAATELPRAAHRSLAERIFEHEGRRAFRLDAPRAKAPGRPVFLDQWDVRKLQAAKAAIVAGANLLLRRASLKWDDLGEIHLAGAFGSRLRPERARRIGLIPPVPGDRIRIAGNAAASGARLALLSKAELERAEEMKRRTRYVELAGRPEFQDAFIHALSFPESRMRF